MQSAESQNRSVIVAGPVRAAQYVRMSTEHQRYSTLNQMDVIRDYASRNGMQIVRTYADEGISGLHFHNRAGLQLLLQHVVTGEADFAAILVYDVSRWGRFQDTDESAHYEFLCRQAGIQVAYCAEPFDNDGGPLSSVVKGIKRVMAAEYSRELSIKVTTGQQRIAALGYRTGGSAGFGLRRMQVDEEGRPQGVLQKGQLKAIIGNRIILVPGPLEEIAVVRSIFEKCAAGKSFWTIARELNDAGIPSPKGCRWRTQPIASILRNEKHIGHNVWGKTSSKLTSKISPNPPSQWVRSNEAFEPIIDRRLYYRAQRAMQRREYPIPAERMLSGLRRLLYERGKVSTALINADKRIPSAATYDQRFGSLRQAYALVGYKPKRVSHFVEIDKALYRLRMRIAFDLTQEFNRLGITAEVEHSKTTIRVGAGIRVHFMALRHRHRSDGSTYWVLVPNPKVKTEVIVVARMKEGNGDILDYYLCPRELLTMNKALLSDRTPRAFDIYRSDTLAPLFTALWPRGLEGLSLGNRIVRAIGELQTTKGGTPH